MPTTSIPFEYRMLNATLHDGRATIAPRRPGAARAFMVAGLTAVLGCLSGPLAATPLQQDIRITLAPTEQQLDARVRLSLPSKITRLNGTTLQFRLHPGLNVTGASDGVAIRRLPDATPGEGSPLVAARYALEIPAGLHAFEIAYRGRIHHPVQPFSGDEARGAAGTPGIISTDGVYLGASSLWYPQIGDELVTFSLDIHLPAGWDAVSQGKRTGHRRDAAGTHVRWEESNPQTDIYLVAGRYHEFSRQYGPVTALAFLRDDDAALAERYLEATGRYIEMFGGLLGPYAYRKFALVENFWETGYGMPSFTLLGSTVVRLPFILHSSYPHEILHNWWGNGVYVDYASGNWAEGLTAYLADHLLQELRGDGAAMRRNHLQRYADYVDAAADFALIDFRARHSPSTEAIGYGKAMMFFHMLRRRLGDEAFVSGLRDFYQSRLFQVAGYEDLRRALAPHAGDDLRDEFRQWVIRSGAPQLRLVAAESHDSGNGAHELRITLEQTQAGPAYRLQIPLAIALDDGRGTFELTVDMQQRHEDLRILLPARPLRVEVDPQFDLFRRVDRREIPPALSQIFGARSVLVVLPAGAPAALREQYRAQANAWRGERDGADFRVVSDAEIDALPTNRSVWLLGWDNRFLPALESALANAPVRFGADGLELPGRTLRRGNDIAVLAARLPADPEHALAWLGADDTAALQRLARRLPHYGRYGYLGFGGAATENILNGQWPVTDSPLARDLPDGEGRMPQTPVTIEYAPRRALVTSVPR